MKHLYRYQPFDLGRLRTILEGKLYCSSPRDFNDPWDCHPFFKLPTTTESRENTIQWLMRADRRHSTRSEADYSQREKELKDNPSKVELKVKEISTTIEAGIRNYRVCCFSARNDLALMWSHYARNHTGICLEFSTDNLVLCCAKQVQYSHWYPDLDVTDDEDLLPLTSKSDVWSYELEYRFIGPVEGSTEAAKLRADGELAPNWIVSENIRPLPQGALISVILGCQMSEENEIAVRAVIERYNGAVLVKRAVRTPDRYDLAIEQA